jgi:hypothetical protein
LPPPRPVAPPSPPQQVKAFQPPPPIAPPPAAVEHDAVVEAPLEADIDEEIALETPEADDVVADDLVAEDLVADVVVADDVVEDDVVEVREVVAPRKVVTPRKVVAARKVVVEPEVNRLALVPDLIDDDSPIELPPITPSGPIVAHQSVYAPVLAETLYVAPAQRVAKSVPVMTVDANQRRRKPKRHLLRTFMTLVVLFGLLAGGAFAAKKYLLKEQTWSVEMKPLADDVATARGLQFKVAVQVTEVPAGDYARRLAVATIGNGSDRAPAWRALGLLNGELDVDAVGRQALNDSPAFYDPATKTVFVTDDLKAYGHLYRFALHRALTTALLDQQYDWSSRSATATPAAALGIRATIDGDALAVANSLAAKDSPELLAPEAHSFVEGHGDTLAQSPYAVAIAGRAGVAMRPTIASMTADPTSLAALEQAPPTNDAVLDAARTDAATASPDGTQGMMFWYYVLASRIDDGQAWSAAARWTGDSLTTSTATGTQCIDARVTAADADGAVVLVGAFQSWAATAPAESATAVNLIDGNQVSIQACDPGAAITVLVPTKVPVVFGGAGVERALVQAAATAAGNARLNGACLISAARLRGTVLSSPADDAPTVAAGWQPPYVTANLDLAAACVSA